MNAALLPDAIAVEAAARELVNRHSLDEIEQVLSVYGVTPVDAAKAVLLVPSAFAAAYFEPKGIGFPTEFHVGRPGALRTLAYASEPLYLEAKKLAAKWIQEGEDLWVRRILDWSAEANAIKEAHAQGQVPARMESVHHGEWWA